MNSSLTRVPSFTPHTHTHQQCVSQSCGYKIEKSANAITKVFYTSIQNVTQHAKDFYSEVVNVGSVNETEWRQLVQCCKESSQI